MPSTVKIHGRCFEHFSNTKPACPLVLVRILTAVALLQGSPWAPAPALDTDDAGGDEAVGDRAGGQRLHALRPADTRKWVE